MKAVRLPRSARSFDQKRAHILQTSAPIEERGLALCTLCWSEPDAAADMLEVLEDFGDLPVISMAAQWMVIRAVPIDFDLMSRAFRHIDAHPMKHPPEQWGALLTASVIHALAINDQGKILRKAFRPERADDLVQASMEGGGAPEDLLDKAIEAGIDGRVIVKALVDRACNAMRFSGDRRHPTSQLTMQVALRLRGPGCSAHLVAELDRVFKRTALAPSPGRWPSWARQAREAALNRVRLVEIARPEIAGQLSMPSP